MFKSHLYVGTAALMFGLCVGLVFSRAEPRKETPGDSTPIKITIITNPSQTFPVGGSLGPADYEYSFRDPGDAKEALSDALDALIKIKLRVQDRDK